MVARTGIEDYPEREQRYTVWIRGFVVYFTHDLDAAIKRLAAFGYRPIFL